MVVASRRTLALAFVCALAGTSQAQAALDFSAPANYATGGVGGPGVHETSASSADFDNDGDLDVAVTDYYVGNGPFVLLNNGDGTFATPGRRVAIGYLVGNVLSGDVNHDGDADLVGTNLGQVFVKLGNGDGTFRDGSTYFVPQGGQEDAQLADSNNDGHPDVLVLTRQGVWNLLGNGDGTFRNGPFSLVPSVFPASIDEANFNNDGKLDLAFSDGAGIIHRLNGTGNGSFTDTGQGVTGLIPATVVAGDFNEDGIDDVAALNEFNVVANAAVLISNAGGGFQPAVYYDGGLAPATGEIADFDEDGNVDILASDVAGSKQVVLRGAGDGTFTVAGKFAVAEFPQTPVVGDFNGDGRLDIAAGAAKNFGAQSVLSVLLQQP